MKRRVRRTSSHLAAPVQQELVLLDQTGGRYFGLNPVATRIWELSAEPISVETLIERIQAEFEVERGTLETDLGRFLSDLEDASLLEFLDD